MRSNSYLSHWNTSTMPNQVVHAMQGVSACVETMLAECIPEYGACVKGI